MPVPKRTTRAPRTEHRPRRKIDVTLPRPDTDHDSPEMCRWFFAALRAADPIAEQILFAGLHAFDNIDLATEFRRDVCGFVEPYYVPGPVDDRTGVTLNDDQICAYTDSMRAALIVGIATGLRLRLPTTGGRK